MKSVILIIDLQVGLFDEPGKPFDYENVNKIVVCGYATEFCVDSTIRAAAALGFEIQIVSDGHTTHNKNHASAKLIVDHHNETLSNIKSFV